MSGQDTTTPTIDPTLGIGAPPPTGTVGGVIPDPTAIGVPKYQTIGGAFVFEGTKYKRVIQGGDGKYYAVDASGAVMTDDKGQPIQDQPTTDRSGTPIRVQAQYGPAPPGSNVNTPAGVTSRIEPGSPAAQLGMAGPARYDEGAEWSLFAQMPAEQRVQVQQAMIDRGIAPSTGVANGAFTTDWLSSFKTILGYANANNQNWEDALASMPQVDRTKTVTVQPNQYEIHLDSPQDLAAVYRKAIAATIGGGAVPQSEVDSFVRAYQEMQRTDQETANAAKEKAIADAGLGQQVAIGPDGKPLPTGTPPGTDIAPGVLPDSAATAAGPVGTGLPTPGVTTTTATESPQQFALDQVKQKYAGRYQATNMANAYGLFVNSMAGLGATGGAAPSTVGTAT
jgi:hypothetical protein